MDNRAYTLYYLLLCVISSVFCKLSQVPPYESSTSTSLNTATMLPSASFPENTCMASSPFSSPSLSDGAPRQIAPLKPHEVRWFYEESGKAWTPFNGHDSLCLEDCYQRLQRQRGSGGECDVSVLGDTYEANLADKMCKPIYWTGTCIVHIAMYFFSNRLKYRSLLPLSHSGIT